MARQSGAARRQKLKDILAKRPTPRKPGSSRPNRYQRRTGSRPAQTEAEVTSDPKPKPKPKPKPTQTAAPSGPKSEAKPKPKPKPAAAQPKPKPKPKVDTTGLMKEIAEIDKAALQSKREGAKKDSLKASKEAKARGGSSVLSPRERARRRGT